MRLRLLLFLAGTAMMLPAQSPDWPFVWSRPPICNPVTCTDFTFSPSFSWGHSAQVTGSVPCANGETCNVRGEVETSYCRFPFNLRARVGQSRKADGSDYNACYLFTNASGAQTLICAQTIWGRGDAYFAGGANLIPYWNGFEDADCYSSATRLHWPPNMTNC